MKATPSFCAADFSPEEVRHAMATGSNLEMGGPTRAYRILGDGPPPYGANTEVFNLDFDMAPPIACNQRVGDATKLPMGDGACDMVLSTALPIFDNTRRDAIVEAWRVLKPGGLFVWQSGFAQDLKQAEGLGFKLAHFKLTSGGVQAPTFQLSEEEMQAAREGKPLRLTGKKPVGIVSAEGMGDFVFRKPMDA